MLAAAFASAVWGVRAESATPPVGAALPRMALRLRAPHTATAEQWRKTYAAIAANPGCCDEVWFSTGTGVPPLDWHRAQAARIAAAADDLRKIGIVPSLQFQATLGHGDAFVTAEECAMKDWTGWTGSTGVEDRFCSCPRQKKFLEYVRVCARIYAGMRPGFLWIDDDLRIDNHAPATDGSRPGCWCATCLADFGAAEGKTRTRTELDAAMRGDAALAARWEAFSVASIAAVAQAIAEEFRRLSPETRMGYQHCTGDKEISSVQAIAETLAQTSGQPVGLRPGGGDYYDLNPADQVVKSLRAVRFRAKVADLDCVDVWCPEVECWPRAYASRSAQSAIVESFVALAYGFNATSLFLLDTRYEDDALYARTTLRPLAAAAPVLSALAKDSDGTVPAGFSAKSLPPDRLYRFALSGVPVLPGVGRDLGALTAQDLALDVFTTGSKDIQALRDALDARAGGAPAVLESPFVGLLVPRVTADGSLRTVALLNTRIGAQGPVALRLRGVPAGAAVVWHPIGGRPEALPVVRGGDVVRVQIPEIGAWNGGFLSVEPAATLSKEKPLFENPLISPDGPDPTVWDGGDGWFYALTTPVQKMHRSRNLVDWEAVAHDPLVPSARLALTNVTSYVWAPCVVKIQDKWLLYVSLFVDNKDCRIPVLASDRPDGPFSYVGMVIDSRKIGILNTIDPCVREADGRVWMFFGSCQDGVHRVELTRDGLSVKPDAKIVHVAGRRNDGTDLFGAPGCWEGAYVLPRHGAWWLFLSGGRYDRGTYHLLVGRAETIDGAFRDREGNLLTEGRARPILSSVPGDRFTGPGHNGDVFTDADGRDWMFFHAHDAKLPNAQDRPMLLQELRWGADGWPYFKEGRPQPLEECPNLGHRR